MIDRRKQIQKQEAKERQRQRMNVQVDPDNYVYYPEKKQTDYYDNDVPQRIGIYVRVSTDDVRQTTSYELQKKYYEDFVVKHPNWTLVRIYADEGISGTSRKKRDQFNAMIEDAKAGKLDMIICKNVSRFARNLADCIGIVRELASLRSPVATMAEEESHTRSRSMETSLRMRLDHGVPLTPKLLGFTHDIDGKLIINPEEAPTVKLAFFMYLYGYSTQQIADTFIALGRRSYLGNICWTSTSIVQILRNERHCGDVLTRKTFTPNYRDHLSRKNRGERPQSRYLNHHAAIVTRDDFIAVQRMLDNAKYRNRSVLPELRVIESGVLKGFVTINPRWAGFKEAEYYQASQSVYPKVTEEEMTAMEFVKPELTIEVEPGDFDMRGFEITRSEFLDSYRRPAVTFSDRKIKFSAEITKKLAEKNFVELLINPIERKFAIRPADKNNRNGVTISKLSRKRYLPKDISSAAFCDTLYSLFEWEKDHKYRIIGSLYEQDGVTAYIFDIENTEVYLKSYLISSSESADDVSIQPLFPSGKRIRAIPEEWTVSFGKEFYLHEMSLQALENQSEQDWNLRLKGRLFESGAKLNVTGF